MLAVEKLINGLGMGRLGIVTRRDGRLRAAWLHEVAGTQGPAAKTSTETLVSIDTFVQWIRRLASASLALNSDSR
jgi:hypothetical protein